MSDRDKCMVLMGDLIQRGYISGDDIFEALQASIIPLEDMPVKTLHPFAREYLKHYPPGGEHSAGIIDWCRIYNLLKERTVTTD